MEKSDHFWSFTAKKRRSILTSSWKMGEIPKLLWNKNVIYIIFKAKIFTVAAMMKASAH